MLGSWLCVWVRSLVRLALCQELRKSIAPFAILRLLGRHHRGHPDNSRHPPPPLPREYFPHRPECPRRGYFPHRPECPRRGYFPHWPECPRREYFPHRPECPRREYFPHRLECLRREDF